MRPEIYKQDLQGVSVCMCVGGCVFLMIQNKERQDMPLQLLLGNTATKVSLIYTAECKWALSVSLKAGLPVKATGRIIFKAALKKHSTTSTSTALKALLK